MAVSKQTILASLATIEAQAPAYFGDMPVADDAIRDIFASAMATLSATPEFERAAPACKEATLLGSLTHAMLEAAYLRHRLEVIGQTASLEASRLLSKVAAR